MPDQTINYAGLSGPVSSLNTAPSSGTVKDTTSNAGIDPAGITPVRKHGKKKPLSPLANQIFRKGKNTLQAYNALLGPTQELMMAAGLGDLNQFRTLAPGYVDAITNADPLQAALRNAANRDVMTGLGAGLSPSSAREIQQGSREAWSSRGLASSPASAIEELFSLGDRGYQQHQTAIGNAMRMLGINQQIIGDPLLAVTGRPSGVRGIGDVPNDALNMQLNSDQQRRNKAAADAANRNALYGAGISAVGSIAGGGAGAI